LEAPRTILTSATDRGEHREAARAIAQAKLSGRDEAPRIAANIAKLINCLGPVCAARREWKALRTFVGPGENANTWADKQDAAAARGATEQKKQKELDDQYKAALGRTQKPIAPSDPWGDVRPTQTAPALKKKQQ